MKNFKDVLQFNEQYSDYKVTNKYAKELVDIIRDKFEDIVSKGAEISDENECIKAMINFILDEFILDDKAAHKALQDCFNKIKNM